MIWTPTSEICTTNVFAFCAADGTLFTYKWLKVHSQSINRALVNVAQSQDHYNYAFSTPAHKGPIDDMAFDSAFSWLATDGGQLCEDLGIK